LSNLSPIKPKIGAHNAQPKASNAKVIRRLMSYMTPFNWIMIISLAARVTKIVFQAAALGIVAA
jgi:ATP-binding cassette subfamily C protein CydC